MSIVPATHPCGSCPYRKDVPSGVWDDSEYDKLPAYDGETFDQPPALFYCHQQDGRLCAGWVGCHDMDENLGLRIAANAGVVGMDEVDIIRDYVTSVPLFSSGAEAAAHGRTEITAPGDAANKTITKLKRKEARRGAA